MPSTTHQHLVYLFRSHPQLVLELALLAELRVDIPHERLEDASTEVDDPLTHRTPVRADLVIAGYEDDRAVLALVLEVQLGKDPDKAWSICLYRAGIRYRLRCPTWAIMFSPDPTVLDWARSELFPRQPELAPLLIEPDMIPVIDELERALTQLPWAVLSAVVHGRGPHALACASAAIRALLRLAPVGCGRYIELVAASVDEETMRDLRAQLPTDEREQLSEWERRGASFIRGQREGFERGLEKGLEQGMVKGLERGLEKGQREGLGQGLEQGLEQGRKQALRAAVVNVLEARGFQMDTPTRQRIEACEDPHELETLVARASTLSKLAEL